MAASTELNSILRDAAKRPLLRMTLNPLRWDDDRCASYSPPDSNAALPPAAAVLMVTVCSVAKRAR
jgi:hypothetical protein